MLGAHARSATGNNLALFGGESLKTGYVLVVDFLDFLYAKRAHLFLGRSSDFLDLSSVSLALFTFFLSMIINLLKFD